mmetsp:Transcript_51959/g.96123  ORF Transcript_51959/g.96123 Transcript_51959/m.96123 type:complete len:707 (+) Transcript_51959:48-2168(+)
MAAHAGRNHGRRGSRGQCSLTLILVAVGLWLSWQERTTWQAMADASRLRVEPSSNRLEHVPRRAASRRVGTLYPKHTRSAGGMLPPESMYGPVEYKLKLNAAKGTARFEELVSQLNWRMRECETNGEGCEVEMRHYGEALYRVGVTDDGQVVGLDEEELKTSMDTLKEMAASCKAVVTILDTTRLADGKRSSVTALVRSTGLDLTTRTEVRICTCGNVDSGKSTLLGVLTRGLQDDGRGKARSPIFRHRHELESGRTSAMNHHLLGFDEVGQVVNYCEDSAGAFRNEVPEHIVGAQEAQARVVERASKLISFVDLCGHEKYFKTTLMGLLGLDPDYLLCTVDANRGAMRGMVREHLLIAKALQIPTIVCLTKIDMADEESIADTLADIKGFLKEADKPAIVIRNRQDVVMGAERLAQGYTPIFLVSAVTGEKIPELKLMLNLLRKRTPALGKGVANDGRVMIVIEDYFPRVPGVGPVVLGRVVRGTVEAGDTLRLGPIDSDIAKGAGLIEVRVSSIQFEGVATDSLRRGQSGTLAIKAIGKSKAALAEHPKLLHRARVLLCRKSRLQPQWELKANVSIVQHPSSIRVGYEPVLHVGVVRQAAKIMSIRSISTGAELDTLRAGDHAEVSFRWKSRPEVLEQGDVLVFREGLTKGIGTVTWVGEDEPTQSKPSRRSTGPSKNGKARGGRGRAAKKVATRERLSAKRRK